MIAAIATSFGVGPKAVKIVLAIIAVIAIIGAFYAILDAYGDSRYEAGEAHADAAWKAASDKLIAKSQGAGAAADKKAAAREAEFAADVEAEKEKIDEALDHGDSPFDVMFAAE